MPLENLKLCQLSSINLSDVKYNVDYSSGGVKNKLDRRFCFTISRLVLFWTGFTAYQNLAKI